MPTTEQPFLAQSQPYCSSLHDVQTITWNHPSHSLKTLSLLCLSHSHSYLHITYNHLQQPINTMAALAHKMGKITLIISAQLSIYFKVKRKRKKKPQTITDIIIPMPNCQKSSYFEHEVNLMSNDDMRITHHIIHFVKNEWLHRTIINLSILICFMMKY